MPNVDDACPATAMSITADDSSLKRKREMSNNTDSDAQGNENLDSVAEQEDQQNAIHNTWSLLRA